MGDADERREYSRLVFERDMALRQAKLSKAGLQVIRIALNENRPLEALRQVNEEIDRLDEELEAVADVLEGDDDHRLAGAKPETPPAEAPRDANDGPVFDDEDVQEVAKELWEQAHLTQNGTASTDQVLEEALTDADIDAEELAADLRTNSTEPNEVDISEEVPPSTIDAEEDVSEEDILPEFDDLVDVDDEGDACDICYEADTDSSAEDDEQASCYECEADITEPLEEVDGAPVCPECGENPLPPLGANVDDDGPYIAKERAVDEAEPLASDDDDEPETPLEDLEPAVEYDPVREDSDEEPDDAGADDELATPRPDEDLDNDERLRRYLLHETTFGAVEGTAAEIGDPIDLGGSSVGYHLSRKTLDGLTVEKAEVGPPAVWRVSQEDSGEEEDADADETEGADTDESDSESDEPEDVVERVEEDESDDEPVDAGDNKAWCGECGEGPMGRLGILHHYETSDDHYGEPEVVDEPPEATDGETEAEDAAADGGAVAVATEGRKHINRQERFPGLTLEDKADLIHEALDHVGEEPRFQGAFGREELLGVCDHLGLISEHDRRHLARLDLANKLREAMEWPTKDQDSLTAEECRELVATLRLYDAGDLEVTVDAE